MEIDSSFAFLARGGGIFSPLQLHGSSRVSLSSPSRHILQSGAPSLPKLMVSSVTGLWAAEFSTTGSWFREGKETTEFLLSSIVVEGCWLTAGVGRSFVLSSADVASDVWNGSDDDDGDCLQDVARTQEGTGTCTKADVQIRRRN